MTPNTRPHPDIRNAKNELARTITHTINTNGWTNPQAAHHLGTGITTIRRIRRTQTNHMSLDILARIATRAGATYTLTTN